MLTLHEMLFQRLVTSPTLADKMASFDGRAAIFHQQAPSADNPKWGKNPQYPRLDYNIDLLENPARNTAGTLMINAWCDLAHGATPEEVEYTLRDLLHATFAQTEEYAFCFAWVRSDAFEATAQKEETTRIIGVTLIFDIMACPSQYTMQPDPIRALNLWTKQVLPEATVIGENEIEGWLIPTRDRPVVYWRLTSQGVQRKHFAHTWLNITVEGHVYARSAADRLFNLTRINTAHALAGHIPMEDGSPLFLRDFSVKPHFNYLAQGQIQASGNFGVLQPWYYSEPDPKLNNAITELRPNG